MPGYLPCYSLASKKQTRWPKNGQSDSQQFKICKNFNDNWFSMIIGCILLRKLDSGQYFGQFLNLTDILYEWQCLLPQNPSQNLVR